MQPRKSLETCPTCEAQDSICLMYGPYVKLDGTTGGDRIPAFCNNTFCDQRYWYYPRATIGASYITRRNTGVTYGEWRLSRVDLDSVNAGRRAESLPQLVLAGEIIDNDEGCPCPVNHDAVPTIAVPARPPRVAPGYIEKGIGLPISVKTAGTEQIFGESIVYGWWCRFRSAVRSLKSYLPKGSKTND